MSSRSRVLKRPMATGRWVFHPVCSHLVLSGVLVTRCGLQPVEPVLVLARPAEVHMQFVSARLARPSSQAQGWIGPHRTVGSP